MLSTFVLCRCNRRFIYPNLGKSKCSIILGYDENGDVLIGWSQFADDPTSDIEGLHSVSVSENDFQKRNRLEKSDALIFIGEKTYIPSIADGIQASIQHIPVFANLAEIDGADGFSACIVLGR